MGLKSRLKRERRERGEAAYRRPAPPGLFGRIYWGALGGLFVAALALVAGALRIALALLRGREIPFDDLHVLGYYVGGFVLAGVIVGLLLPFARSTLARLATGVLGAGVMLGSFVIGIAGSPAGWDGAAW